MIFRKVVGITIISVTPVGGHVSCAPAVLWIAGVCIWGVILKSLIVMIDGGHLRVLSRKAGYQFDPNFIEKFASRIPIPNEDLIRILYYDCRPFEGQRKKPVTGASHDFNKKGDWLDDLAARDLFAVRLGVLKWRGWKPKHRKDGKAPTCDEDFIPDFEQKGVDLRIGLDIATFSVGRKVDRIALITGDTDLIPAMKLARREGLQVVGVELPNQKTSRELAAHFDFKRKIDWE